MHKCIHQECKAPGLCCALVLDECHTREVLGFQPNETNALVKWFLERGADVNLADEVCCMYVCMCARVRGCMVDYHNKIKVEYLHLHTFADAFILYIHTYIHTRWHISVLPTCKHYICIHIYIYIYIWIWIYI